MDETDWPLLARIDLEDLRRDIAAPALTGLAHSTVGGPNRESGDLE
jgi:hypothetical protein